MVKVSDCTCCDCDSAQEKEQIKERALSSINKIYTTDAKTYYPDGTGMVTLPIPSAEQIAQMEENTEKIEKLESDVAANAEDITATQKDVDDLAGKLGGLTTGYTLYRNGEGKVMLQAEAADGSLLNSNTLDMIIPYQYDLISGTTSRSFKLQITMSDGSSYTTNDFVIPEGGGTDVTVTGIVLSKDTGDVNRFHVGINLSDGTMIDSGYISMVDSVGAAVADGKLTITVNGVSSVPVELPEGVTYSAGDGIKIESGTISISDDLASRLTTIESDITNTLVVANRAYDDVEITDSTLTFTRGNGGTTQIEIPGGNGWDELDLSNLPTDFKENDMLFFEFFPITINLNSTSWDADVTNLKMKVQTYEGYDSANALMIIRSPTYSEIPNKLLSIDIGNSSVRVIILSGCSSASYMNNTSETDNTIAILTGYTFNGYGTHKLDNINITRSNITTYVRRLFRKVTN